MAAAGSILYLDVDDEITSAAARIRAAEAVRIALVVPPGSRIATSRINFRLLAREAVERNRRLAIVAPDAASRALAASAGLPVFASVTEFEESLGRPEDRPQTQGLEPVIPATPSAAAPSPPAPAPEEVRPRSAAASLPIVGGRERGARRWPVGGIAAIVALVVLAAIVGSFVLPSASIVVTPRVEPIGPLQVTVRADPAASSVDVGAGVIPAQKLSFDLAATDTFQATGKRVVDSAATGSVTFDSINTVGPVPVPKGTHLSTLNGVVFATTAYTVVPAAAVAGNTIRHGFATVGVQAAKPGPDGNVDSGAITQVPDFLRVQQVSASNGAATTGGDHQEFPRIARKDVDGAIASLTTKLNDELKANLADSAKVPAGLTAFPGTAVLGTPTPSVDPATLVAQEVASFQLGLTATATVTAVDQGPLRQVAEAHLRSAVAADHDLVAGSISVTVGTPTVSGEAVTFPVTASGRQVARIDAAALRRRVAGTSIAEARNLLSTYGDVTIDVWPAFVGSIPTLDFRLDLRVATGAPTEPPAAGSPTPVTSP